MHTESKRGMEKGAVAVSDFSLLYSPLFVSRSQIAIFKFISLLKC